MKIFIGADHRGFPLKEELKKWLYDNGFEYEDMGAYELDSRDDYPVYAERVTQKVSDALKNSEESRGIVLCGSGVGVDIVANKFHHIRCGLGINADQIKVARLDDDINILAIPSDFVNQEEAQKMLQGFLETGFDDAERHERRIREIEEIEEEN